MDLYLYIVLLDRLIGPAPLYQLGFCDQHSSGFDQRQQDVERTAAQFHRFAVSQQLALASTDFNATEAQCFLLLHWPTGNHR
jgi:hypothetical protein